MNCASEHNVCWKIVLTLAPMLTQLLPHEAHMSAIAVCTCSLATGVANKALLSGYKSPQRQDCEGFVCNTRRNLHEGHDTRGLTQIYDIRTGHTSKALPPSGDATSEPLSSTQCKVPGGQARHVHWGGLAHASNVAPSN